MLYQSARSLARIHQYRGHDDPIHYSREKIPAAAAHRTVGSAAPRAAFTAVVSNYPLSLVPGKAAIGGKADTPWVDARNLEDDPLL